MAKQHRPELLDVQPNHRGCMPIFYVEIVAKWKTIPTQKSYEPPVTYDLVYKGLPNLQAPDYAAQKNIKDHLFKKHFKGPVPDTVYKTFTVASFKLFEHLGFENDPGI